MSKELFVDWVAKLCSQRNLIDVAPQGQASQSSYSSLSKPDDPARALSRHFDEYAFHTDLEDGPWWLLDLKGMYNPEYIVVCNRRNRDFYWMANHIDIAVSSDGVNYEPVYVGKAFFGCDPADLPLTLHLNGEFYFRFLRISHRSTMHLHLSRVHVLMRDAKPIFIAKRDDGFGERLKTLLNAIVLASHFDTDFRFGWPPLDGVSSANAEFHAISSPEETFAANFIEAHSIANFEYLPEIEFDALTENWPSNLLVNKGIVLHQNSLINLPEHIQGAIRPGAFSDAFNAIDFSIKIEDARSEAKNVPISSDAAAIHIRSGDLILGSWRYVDDRWDDKLMLFFVALCVIQQQEGKDIVVFGQESSLIDYIVENTGSIAGERYCAEHRYNREQQAIFDITLMSRCKEIYAGKSGFAAVASWIGESRVINPTEELSVDEIIKCIVDGLNSFEDDPRVDKLHISYSHWYVYKNGKNRIDRTQQLCHLKLAMSIDSTNPLYRLAMAAELYADEQREEADKYLCDAAEAARDETYGLYDVLKPKWDGYVTGNRFLAPIREAAEAGRPIACAVVAVFEHAAGRSDEASRFARVANGHEKIPFRGLVEEIASGNYMKAIN